MTDAYRIRAYLEAAGDFPLWSEERFSDLEHATETMGMLKNSYPHIGFSIQTDDSWIACDCGYFGPKNELGHHPNCTVYRAP